MTKRKISCVSCRLKKVKCNGERIHVTRCLTHQTKCVYEEPRAVGRPPKNAVVNKLVLSRSNNNTVSLAREFILEIISLTPVLAPARYIRDAKEIGLSHYVNTIFTAYFKKASSFNQSADPDNMQMVVKKGDYTEFFPKIKIYDLSHYFTWMSAEIANILMRRMSQLKLTYYKDLEYSTMALGYDNTTNFFESQSADNINPLNSLPPHQAIRLIECFFCIHPYSCLLNKTMILQSYWTDTTDPLLLAVIYGTTVFKTQLLDGKPLELCDALNLKNRNIFLDYAYVLLSKATAEVTPNRYQALVLLALFEVPFGFPKRGSSLFGLSYMMATRLGLFDNTMPPGLNPVEKELLLMTFWAAYECTIRGCIECKCVFVCVCGGGGGGVLVIIFFFFFFWFT